MMVMNIILETHSSSIYCKYYHGHGNGNINAVRNRDGLPVNNDAGQEGAAVGM